MKGDKKKAGMGMRQQEVFNDLRKFHHAFLTRNASIQLPKKEGLPRAGEWGAQATQCYLKNLLPETNYST